MNKKCTSTSLRAPKWMRQIYAMFDSERCPDFGINNSLICVVKILWWIKRWAKLFNWNCVFKFNCVAHSFVHLLIWIIPPARVHVSFRDNGNLYIDQKKSNKNLLFMNVSLNSLSICFDPASNSVQARCDAFMKSIVYSYIRIECMNFNWSWKNRYLKDCAKTECGFSSSKQKQCKEQFLFFFSSLHFSFLNRPPLIFFSSLSMYLIRIKQSLKIFYRNWN